MKVKNDFVKNLNLFGGTVEYDDFYVDENIPFQEQLDAYKEDILQISFGERFLIDVGFYPEMNAEGCFVVYAIQDYDWQSPLIEKECHSLAELKKVIEEAATLLSIKSAN